MNPPLVSLVRPALTRSALALCCLAAAPRLSRAAGLPPPGRVISLGHDAGGVYLSLPGIQDANYSIEVKNTITNTAWDRLADVTGTDGTTVFPLPPDSSPSRFFRVLFPQPVLAAGEPAFAAGAGGETLYITGQFFYPGDTVRVGGVTLGPATFISPTLLSVTLPPLPPGLHDLEVLSGYTGAQLAFLPASLEVDPPPLRTLQSPPEWPPAGPASASRHRGHVTVLKSHAGGGGDDGFTTATPSRNKKIKLECTNGDIDILCSRSGRHRGHVTVLKSHDSPPGGLTELRGKKGYDHYQARSDVAAAGLHNNPVFQENDTAGEMPSTWLAAWFSKKGYDYYQAQSALQASRHRGHVTVLKAHDQDCDGLDGDSDLAAPGSPVAGSLEVDLAVTDSATLVRLHSGEVCHQACDLDLPGRGLDFAWTRTYRSRTGADASPQGARWTHAYDVRAVASGDTVEVADGTGRRDTYRLQADGTYACPGLFREGAFTGGVFRLTFADTGFWAFRPFDGTPAAGRLARIEDRNGNAVTLAYSPEGRLASVTDPLGRAHTVAYTPEGRVASVTDSTGRTVTYAYYADREPGGNPGDLKSVTSPPVTGTPTGNDFPDGKTVTYTYTSGHADARANRLLSTITDARGNTAATFAYDLDPVSPALHRCVSVRCGGETPACLTYLPQTPAPENRFAAMRCVVNDPVGNVTEAFFDLRNRCVALHEYTGRAVAGTPVGDASNRPAAKLRPDDPDRFDTLLSWNNDNLCTRLALPSGLVGLFQYGGDANTAARMRKRPELLYQAWDASASGGADLDGDGIPDLVLIERRFAYDPRFGSDPACPPSSPYREHTAVLAAACSSGAGTRRKGGGSLCGSTSHFIVAETDPNGNTTSAEYDDRGNCTRIVTPFTDVTDADRLSEWAFAYDAHGQPTEVTCPEDAAGRRRKDLVTWWNGRVQQVVCDSGPGGLALAHAFEYDARGNLTRLVDPRTNDVLATYNALNQPVTVARQSQGASFGERVTTALHYDACDNLVRVVRQNRGPDGAFDPTPDHWSTWLGYDALNRPTLLAHELTHTVQQRVMTNLFVYDANGRLTLHLLPEAAGGAEPDNAVARAYDERGLLFSEARAPGTGLSTVDTFDYDANGNLRRVSRDDGLLALQSEFVHDGFDRAVKFVDPMGNVATRCFDANGNLVYARADGETDDQPGDKGNRRLAETRVAYDALDRPTRQVDSFFDVFTQAPLFDGERRNTWRYAPNGQLAAATGPNGSATTYAYDRAGRLASVTDPAGNTSSCAYDPNGNLLSLTQTDRSDVTAGEQRFVTRFSYDPLNRLVRVSDNLDNAVTYAYDSCDNLVGETDAAGNETVFDYDGLGRCVSAACYAGEKERGITINTTHVEYRNRRLVSATDGNGHTTTFAYDACDRRVLVTRPDATAESLVWSPRSNLRAYTDATGTSVTNTYDRRDRLVHRDIAARNGVLPATTFESFTYDGLHRLVAAQNDASLVAFAYDSLGHRVFSAQDGFVTTALYDASGNRRVCTCPSGYTVRSSYDALNRPADVSVQAPGAGATNTLATFAYDGPDRLARVARANGVNTRLFWNGRDDAPNAPGDFGWQRVARLNHARAGGGLVVDQRASAYDRAQNRVLRAQTAPWSSGGPLVTNRFDYDGLHRLTRGRRASGASVLADFTYVYDANGNRLAVTNSGMPEAYVMDATLPEPADAQMNQYSDTPFGSLVHDARGDRRGRHNSVASLTYHYDYAGRLVQADRLNAVGEPEPIAAYTYDALGRRIARTVFDGGGLPPATTVYLYDDGRDDDCDGLADDLLEIFENGARARTFVMPHVFDRNGRGAATFDTTLFLTAVINDEGDPLYVHADDLGSVLALTDSAGGVVERYDYDDFGTPTFHAADGAQLPGSTVGHDLLFRGLLWDPATELYATQRRGGNPLYDGPGHAGDNPLYTGKARAAAGGGGGTTWHECFLTGYAAVVDPQTGQTLGRDGSLFAAGGGNDRTFAGNNPWTLKKEEGGRHTPFHNRAGDDPVLRKRPGRVKYGDITLKRGYATISNVLKTKHDTVKNSVSNIR